MLSFVDDICCTERARHDHLARKTYVACNVGLVLMDLRFCAAMLLLNFFIQNLCGDIQ